MKKKEIITAKNSRTLECFKTSFYHTSKNILIKKKVHVGLSKKVREIKKSYFNDIVYNFILRNLNSRACCISLLESYVTSPLL